MKALSGGALYFYIAMALPFFYVKDLGTDTIVLDEDTSKHVVQVLRMKRGEALLLTDGRGGRAQAVITVDNRKRCGVKIEFLEREEGTIPKIAIAISLLKNNTRFEWFLEKATEIGVNEIIPLLCERTERQSFRHDRMNQLLISAMLQSQQCWLPVLRQPVSFPKAVELPYQQKFIAHCEDTEKQSLTGQRFNASASQLILIGPEGDFTPNEIEQALANGFLPVALGETRLRTETAGMVAAAVLRIKNGQGVD